MRKDRNNSSNKKIVLINVQILFSLLFIFLYLKHFLRVKNRFLVLFIIYLHEINYLKFK